MLTELEEPAIQVSATPWACILEGARARLHFFQQRLELSASADAGLLAPARGTSSSDAGAVRWAGNRPVRAVASLNFYQRSAG